MLKKLFSLLLILSLALPGYSQKKDQNLLDRPLTVFPTVKLVTPSKAKKAALQVRYQVSIPDTITYTYLAYVVPGTKGFLTELGQGSISDGKVKPVLLVFDTTRPVTVKDRFYFVLYDRRTGSIVGYTEAR